MPGFLRGPDRHVREVARTEAVAWIEPECDVCSSVFGKIACQKGNFGKLSIVEEYHLDGSHVIHLIAPHYVYARLESMQVMATMDESMWLNPFNAAVKVLAHLGFLFKDGVIVDAES